MKTGFLKIAALRGSDFDPLAARSSLSPPREPVQAANLTVAIHTHTQALNLNGGMRWVRQVPEIPAQALLPEIPAQALFMWPYIALPPRSGILGTYCPVWRHLEAREQCPTKPTYLPAFVLHDLPTTHPDDCHRDTHTVPPYGGIDAIAVRELYRHKVRNLVSGRKL